MLAKLWTVALRSAKILYDIDADQRAAAFGFYAFFSLFPLILLSVWIGALFTDPADITATIIEFISSVLPLNEDDSAAVFSTVRKITESRGKIGILAVFGLIYTSTHFFHALVRAVNRAWHTVEERWWKVPIKSCIMIGIFGSALIIGIIVPLAISMVKRTPWGQGVFVSLTADVLTTLVPVLVLFYGLCMLYKFAPKGKIDLRNVWPAALLATLLLKLMQRLLLFYSYEIWHVGRLYGAVSVLVILLLWIYLCGVIIIYGGCFAAAYSAVFPAKKTDDGPPDSSGERSESITDT